MTTAINTLKVLLFILIVGGLMGLVERIGA